MFTIGAHFKTPSQEVKPMTDHSKATPRPWICNQYDADSPVTIQSTTGKWVCKISSTGNWAKQSQDTVKANAALIVEAVNNHDRLVEENKRLRDALGILHDNAYLIDVRLNIAKDEAGNNGYICKAAHHDLKLAIAQASAAFGKE
jgi:hypothetical protein